MKTLFLQWNAPERWAEPDLAKDLKDWVSQYDQGKNYNLYNDLARCVNSRRITGRLVELMQVSAGKLALPNFGDVKLATLKKFLAHYLHNGNYVETDEGWVRKDDAPDMLASYVNWDNVVRDDAGRPLVTINGVQQIDIQRWVQETNEKQEE